VETYGAGAYPIDSVKCWVKQYDGGRRDPTDLSQPGMPVSDVAEAVSQLRREEPFSSTRHIAAQLRLSRKSVKRTLVSVLGMRKFSFRWVPHDLTEFQNAQSVKNSRGLLKVLKVDAKNNFVNIITGDERWYYWSYEHESQWSTSRATVPSRTFQKIDTKKSMFTFIFSECSLLTLNQLPKGQKMNTQYFCDVVLQETRESLTSIPEKSGIEGMMIHLDTWKVHNSARTTLQFQDFQVTRLPHPTYSPDISPCDFWFFGWSKEQMRGSEFHGADEVRSFLLNYFSGELSPGSIRKPDFSRPIWIQTRKAS
jgi:histone-lysine N-methyltransferase SETMAR